MTLRRPRRIDGFSYRGYHRYFLTFCTANRRPHFTNTHLVTTARLRIEQTATEERFSILAICFMADHVHLVIVGLTETPDARRLVKIAKQRVTLQVGRSLEDQFRPPGEINPILAPFDALDASRRNHVDLTRGAAMRRSSDSRRRRPGSR